MNKLAAMNAHIVLGSLCFCDRPRLSGGHAGWCGKDPGGGALPAAV